MNHPVVDQFRPSRPIKVIGHCHPDTDAVCSAIAYSRLKSELDPDHRFLPCRAGLLNRETKFVLQYFDVEPPELFTDVSPRISDVDYRRMPGVDGGISLRQAWVTMRDRQADTLCVVDDVGKLVGLVTMRDMITANMDMIDDFILARAKTSYRNLIETLNAEVVLGDVDDRVVEGHIVVGAGSIEVVEQYVSTGDVVIVSNRADSQLAAIEMGAGCIVVCTGARVSRTICMFAEERGCIVLSTPFSTYAAGQMIVQAAPIRHYMVMDNLLTFTPHSPVESAIKVMASVRHRYFPIVDDAGHYLGMVSRRNLLNLKKQQLILVDHNEKSQAVDGLEDAEILEIIDHHRLSSLETDSPVYFRNVPVGCTSTIVFQMFMENDIEPDRSTAGLLLSAILSDTLVFRSPTSTAADVQAARRLAELAGVEIDSYAEAMFEAGSDVTGKSPEELLNIDYKLFSQGEIRFGVSQNLYMTEKSRLDSEALVGPYLESFRAKQGINCVFSMFTDVRTTSTDLLMAGDEAAALVRSAFGVEPDGQRVVLPDVVSRKKQVIPALLNAIRMEQGS